MELNGSPLVNTNNDNMDVLENVFFKASKPIVESSLLHIVLGDVCDERTIYGDDQGRRIAFSDRSSDASPCAEACNRCFFLSR